MLREAFLGLLRREDGFKLADSFTHFWLIGSVVEQCLAEKFTTLLEYAAREVTILVASVRRPAERSLQSETI